MEFKPLSEMEDDRMSGTRDEFDPELAIRKYCIYHCDNKRTLPIGDLPRCGDCHFYTVVNDMLFNGWRPDGGPE
jgi:hypothetical protein